MSAIAIPRRGLWLPDWFAAVRKRAEVAGGKKRRLRAGGKRTRNLECCCEGGGGDCDPPDCINGPHADFSYNQISDDPCCFEFFGEHTDGGCTGSETPSHHWDFGDGSTSTEENPTHCYDEPGDYDVTYTYCDSAGCCDSVVGEVSCEDMIECNCCEDDMPDSITVIMSGWANEPSGCPTGNCPLLNGQFTLIFNEQSTPPSVCDWVEHQPGDTGAIPKCGELGTNTMQISAGVRCGGPNLWSVQINVFGPHDGNLPYLYQSAEQGSWPWTCRGTFELSLISQPPKPHPTIVRPCTAPATITLVAT